ncbi:MAG: deoxyribose-phosphate aldolase [Clostridia bacterium]|nr:deoxyribose-phosphate aldolase [Clostridia bacterium]
MMNALEAARLIDVSAVRSHHTLKDIEYVAELARRYRFINVHVLPCWVKTLSAMLKDVEGVFVGAPVGFPGGAHRTEVKALEARLLAEDGVQEMDVVMNVGRFKNREYAFVLDDLRQVIACAGEGVVTKVIIELNCLEDDEIGKACEIVMESGADYIKTGTGWVPGGANVERIRRIKGIVGSRLKIKAAGGIRTKDDFLRLRRLGVERFGINTASAVEIVTYFG